MPNYNYILILWVLALGLELLPTPTSPTPKSWTVTNPLSGLLLISPLNITPRPFAPFPTAKKVPTSGVGGWESLERVLCHLSWWLRLDKRADEGSDISSLVPYRNEGRRGHTVPVDTGSMIVRSGFAGRNLVLSINRFKSGSAWLINLVLYGHLESAQAFFDCGIRTAYGHQVRE